MLGDIKNFAFPPLFSGGLLLIATLFYLGVKKYIEKVAENLADLHTTDWKKQEGK